MLSSAPSSGRALRQWRAEWEGSRCKTDELPHDRCHFHSRCWCQAAVGHLKMKDAGSWRCLLPISLQGHQDLWLKPFLLDHRAYLFPSHLSTWVTYLFRWLEDDSSILQQLLLLSSKAKRKNISNVLAKPESHQNIPSLLNISCGRRSQLEHKFLAC